MQSIKINQSLKELNSFGLSVTAKKLFEPTGPDDLDDFFRHHYDGERTLLLGEGSNTLFTSDFDGIIIHPVFRGTMIEADDGEEIQIRVGAGENWDSFVAFSVENGWYGAENLSLIPGSVGSVPVQNIGAYGTEAGEIISRVDVYDRDAQRFFSLSPEECCFGYRSSLFKKDEGKDLIVTSVVFRLRRTKSFNLGYGDVHKQFMARPVQDLKTLRETIIDIRRKKLPDPAETGNAGSFFKNPVIPSEQYEDLKKIWDAIPGYLQNDNRVKIPAAWLIQQNGWKGHREGDAGCWPEQPLVIVNYGKASGMQLLSLSEKIAASVSDRFGITLEREVRVV